MKFLAFILISILGSSCQLMHQIREPVVINQERAPSMGYKNTFAVYFDPTINRESLEQGLERGYQEWYQLKKNFFKEAKKRIIIVVYKDRLSYNKHAVHLPKSTARFDRKTNRIHLTLTTSQAAWRHELIHAMLDGIRTASLRVQEGLAWFLHHQNFTGSISCSPPTSAYAVKMAPMLSELRNSKAPELDQFFAARTHSQKTLRFSARSAYYMQFLWQKKVLQKSLQFYLKYPHSHFEYEITRGDLIRKRRLYKEFNQWLRSSAPAKNVRGC